MSALDVRELTLVRRGMTLVKGLNVTVSAGSVLAMTGPSGAGKTTLLRTLAGLTPPDGGEVVQPGGRVGVVFQEARLLPWRTALDNVAVVLPGGVDERRRQARRWLEKVGLADAITVLPAQLSGGMRQRVAIARAFAIEPSVVYVDEPFSALDTALASRLREELAALIHDSHLVAVWITHDRTEADAVGTAHLALDGPPDGSWCLT